MCVSYDMITIKWKPIYVEPLNHECLVF